MLSLKANILETLHHVTTCICKSFGNINILKIDFSLPGFDPEYELPKK